MNNASKFHTLLNQCRALTEQKRYREALTAAQQLLAVDQNNLATHKLLATLYGLNNDNITAHLHYIMLVQFDESYTLENCLRLAELYAEKKLYKAAALICEAAIIRYKDKRLYQLAADCYEAAGEKSEADRIRNKI